MISHLDYGIEIESRDGDWITRFLSSGHYYEGGMLERIRRLGEGLVFIDAGAFVGTHSLFFAIACNARAVYAYEPHTESYSLLKANIDRNSAHVEAFNVALSDNEGIGAMIDHDPGNMGMARLIEGDDVAVTTIDAEVARLGLDAVDVIKIDVEGMSMDVLRGAARTIERFGPMIFVECETDQASLDVREFLSGCRYRKGSRYNSTPTFEYERMVEAA